MIHGHIKYTAIRLQGDKYNGELIVQTDTGTTIKVTASALTTQLCYSSLIAEAEQECEDMNVVIHNHPKLMKHPNWRHFVTGCCDVPYEHESNFIMNMCPKCGRFSDSYIDTGTDQTNLPF